VRINLRHHLLLGSLSALALGACSSLGSIGATENVDTFDGGSLANYTVYETPGAWAVSGGYLTAGTSAVQSVVIRKGVTMEDGWVETETDRAADGGLVLRFESEGNYYLLAIRDDSRFDWANLEMYRAWDGEFQRLAEPVDLPFPPGERRTIRFEARGHVLTAYLDGVPVLQVTDDTYTSGGFGVRHDNTRGEKSITSRFGLLRWSPS
jgi:hypothetical protein